MKPSRALIITTAVWATAGLLPAILEGTFVYWVVAGVLIVATVVGDGFLGRQFRGRDLPLSLERRQGAVLTVDRKAPWVLEAQWGEGHPPRFLKLYETLPPDLESNPCPLVLRRCDWDRLDRARVDVTCRPLRRGSWSVEGFQAEFPSPFGFWSLSLPAAASIDLRAYPDVRLPGRDDELLTVTEFAGQLPVRRRGEGTDFRELRDYVPGDPIRSVDWRATSRRDHPVVKVFQEEQDQQVLILLDGGYRLHQREGDRVQFEYALQAALRLARVSLAHQDSVGLQVYGEEELWVAPGKGSAQFKALLDAVYDFHSAPVPTSPAAALEHCLARLKRRTFLLLITNLREEDKDTLSWVLPLVSRRHLLMTVSLREEGAEPPRSVETFEQALLYSAAVSYRQTRFRRQRLWEKQGVLTLDARPADLSARLIDRYLSLKRGGVL